MSNHNIPAAPKPRVRARLRARDGDLCCWCHEPMQFDRPTMRGKTHPEYATIEHVIPLSLGGSQHYDNLALAHHRCNTSRRGCARPKLVEVAA